MTTDDQNSQPVHTFVRLLKAVRELSPAIDAFCSAIADAVRVIIKAVRTFFRWWERVTRPPKQLSPAYAYRMTQYGRVPRLTPAMRERQRALRQRGGRR